MRRPLLLLLLAALLPQLARAFDTGRFIDTLPAESSEYVAGYNLDKALANHRAAAGADIEGVWVMTVDGALVAIERANPRTEPLPCYRMLAVRSENAALRPGALLGYLSPTAKPGTYDCRLYTRLTTTGKGVMLSQPKHILVTLGDDRLQFADVRSGLQIKWARLLPYLIRRAVEWKSANRDGLDGCLRYSEPLPRYF